MTRFNSTVSVINVVYHLITYQVTYLDVNNGWYSDMPHKNCPFARIEKGVFHRRGGTPSSLDGLEIMESPVQKGLGVAFHWWKARNHVLSLLPQRGSSFSSSRKRACRIAHGLRFSISMLHSGICHIFMVFTSKKMVFFSWKISFLFMTWGLGVGNPWRSPQICIFSWENFPEKAKSLLGLQSWTSRFPLSC